MADGQNMFNRPVTQEEIDEILRDRARRLDPANRPDNAEVDNSAREWDYDLNDWVDLIKSRPADFEYPAAPLRVTERPTFLRPLGLALVLVICFFLWLTWAFFSKTFTEYDDVTLTVDESGLSLPSRADVKLRGMIVGVVRDVSVRDGRVVMTLGMDRS